MSADLILQTVPSHVAILVPSVRKAALFLQPFGFQIDKEEVWEGEGTKEIYVEKDKRNSLLLMEPTKPGAYQRALEIRGPGIHHLAIDVLDVEAFIESLGGSGWLLHPKSIKMIKESRTAFLARPGFPALIEVQQKKASLPPPLFVQEITMFMDKTMHGLLHAIGLENIVQCSDKSTKLKLEEKIIQLSDLI